MELPEFDRLMEQKLNDFKRDVKEGTISGYVDGEETYINLMNELSARGYSYSTKASECYKPDENIWFSKNSVKNHRSPSVHAFGSPFSLIKTTYLDCTLGSRYCRKSKENVYEADHPNQKKRRMLNGARPTKKLDCPAWMTIKSIKVYPDFISEKLSWRVKKKMMLELKNTLKSSPPPRNFLRYYFKATTGQSHSHSTACMQLNQEIHPDLAKEIQRIVQNGTTSVRDVKMLLEQYVEKLFADDSKPKPARINKAFYPTDKVIYAHIYSAKKSQIAQAVSSLAVQNYEYIIIDGEVTEVAEVCTISEEIHNVPITDEVAKTHDVGQEIPDCPCPAANEVAEVSHMNNEIKHVPSTGEVAEASQADEVQNVSATGEVAAVYQENEVQSAPATDEIAAVYQVCEIQNTAVASQVAAVYEVNEVQNIPAAGEVTEIPHVHEELPNDAEPSSSLPENLEKVQQNVRDKAKRIMDLSYLCNDVEALTSVNLALTEQCTEMESKVDLR